MSIHRHTLCKQELVVISVKTCDTLKKFRNYEFNLEGI